MGYTRDLLAVGIYGLLNSNNRVRTFICCAAFNSTLYFFLILYIYTISVFEFFLFGFCFLLLIEQCASEHVCVSAMCADALSAPLRHRASSASFRQLSIRFTMHILLCIWRRVLSLICVFGGGTPFYAANVFWVNIFM